MVALITGLFTPRQIHYSHVTGTQPTCINIDV